jgi:LPXTG-site transpeptidase (sortase) family protein
LRVYNGDSPNRYQVGTDSQPLRVHVVEALLTLNKTNDKIAVTVDAGDTVTYTITINNTAPSHTTAFDAHYVDILPAADLTLIPASVSSSSSGGVLGITNTNPSGAGNRVEFTIDSIPVGGQVILTYQATVNNSVTPQQAIDNTGDLTWTSLPGDHGTSPNATGSTTPGNSGDTNGERNGSGGINNYAATDTSTVNIATPQLEKSIYVTSESHTSGSDLTIGEEVTYDILFTIPEGTTPSDQVVDTMPTGPGPTDLRLQVIGTPQVILSGIPSKSDFSGTIGGTSVTVGPVGESVTFTFTNISVPADNNNNNNSILLRFTALVLNVGGNQNTDTLSNTATNQVGSNAPTNSNTVDSQIVEAVLQVNKTVDDNRPAPGQTVHFTLTLAHENPGVVSLADAFDVSLSDVLPAQLDLDASPGAIDMNCSGCTVVNTSDDLTNTVSAIVVHFPLGATLTITFDAIVVSPYPMPIIDNTVTATWTSLPGPKGTGSITPGNSGDTNGERNGSGGINDYIDSDTIRLSETRNLTKNLIATSAPSTGNVGGREQVTIGEILTYQVVLTIPAGSTDTAIITDTLDHGLAFVDCSQMTASANITSTKGSPPVTWVDFNDVNNCRHGTSVGSNPLIQNSGQTITFDLGNITNGDTAPHDITLTYRVVVLDITQNVRNVFLSNSVVWTWATGTLPRVLAPQVEIIEPGLGIDKSVDPTVASPGATITYTIRVFHTPNSQTDAFDVTIFDVVPDGVTYVPGSLQHVTGSGPAPDILDDTGMDPVTGRVRLSAFWYSFPLGTPPSALTESLLQFQATVPDPPISRSITNTANVEWTSLPGPVPAPPATFLSAYEQPDSHERRYEPGSPADIYGVSDSASATVPRAPGTGFAPGEITLLPPQPEDRQYQDLGDLWLEIPHLGVRLPIVGIPVTADGEWDLTWLGDQAGYLDGTAYPTHAGNSVLTAHVYLPDGTPGPFVDLHTLGWGDQVIVHLDGQRYIYEVRQEKIVSPDSTTVFKHEDYPWLTLITCKDYDAATDTYAHRVLVRAVLVKIDADPALSPPSNGR